VEGSGNRSAHFINRTDADGFGVLSGVLWADWCPADVPVGGRGRKTLGCPPEAEQAALQRGENVVLEQLLGVVRSSEE